MAAQVSASGLACSEPLHLTWAETKAMLLVALKAATATMQMGFWLGKVALRLSIDLINNSGDAR